jgi:DNA-binding NarL/FixJ family response regulator
MEIRCLVVDDNEAFLASAKRLLELQGLQVVGAVSTGAEAARVALELLANVALVDVDLDDESGFDVARLLTSAQPPVKVILISAYPEDELADLVAASPAAGFIAKSKLGAAAIRALLA